MRRGGAKYRQIADYFGVSEGRAQQLVMRALRAEARLSGFREPSEAAYDSIKFRRRRRLPDTLGA